MTKEVELFVEVDHPTLGALLITGYVCPADPECNIYTPYGEVERVYQGAECILHTVSKEGPLTFRDISYYQDNLVCSGQPFSQAVFITWLNCYYPVQDPAPGPSRPTPPSNAREVAVPETCSLAGLLAEIRCINPTLPDSLFDAVRSGAMGAPDDMVNALVRGHCREGYRFLRDSFWAKVNTSLRVALRNPKGDFAARHLSWLRFQRDYWKRAGAPPRAFYTPNAALPQPQKRK